MNESTYREQLSSIQCFVEPVFLSEQESPRKLFAFVDAAGEKEYLELTNQRAICDDAIGNWVCVSRQSLAHIERLGDPINKEIVRIYNIGDLLSSKKQ